MIQIPLTQGQQALVDDSDADMLLQWNWYASWIDRSKTFYARRSVRENGRVRAVLMHGLITGWSLVDHIDGNGLNNQRSNLRKATNKQNSRNARSRVGVSQYKGVSWRSDSQKWRAGIRVDNVFISLGSYISEIEAAIAYNQAATEYFGEFAHLNEFPAV